MKRSRILTGLTALALSIGLALAGCEGPTGADGASGGGGGNSYVGGVPLFGPAVTDTQLAAAFAASEARAVYAGNVVLAASVTSVYGIVPAGRKLIALSESGLAVGTSGTNTLFIEGELELDEDVQFDATGDILGGTGGTISFGAGGKVTLKSDSGIAVDDVALLAKVSAAAGATGTVKSLGATAANVGDALAETDFVAISGAIDSSATAAIQTGLTDGKTLVLAGASGINAALDLGTAAGTLLIPSGATATLGAFILTGNDPANIFVEGTLALGQTGSKLAGAIDVGDGGTIDVAAAITNAIPEGVIFNEGSVLDVGADADAAVIAADLTDAKVAVTASTATLQLPVTSVIGELALGAAIEISGGGTSITITKLTNSAAASLTIPGDATKLSIGTIETDTGSDTSITLVTATGATIGSLSGGTGGLTLPANFTVKGAGNATGTVVFVQAAIAVTGVSTAEGVTTVETATFATAGTITIGATAKLKAAITAATAAHFPIVDIVKLATGSSLAYGNTEFTSTPTTLTVPAGVTLAGSDTGNTWAGLTTLTVNGTFTPGAAATLEGASLAITINGGGKLDIGAAGSVSLHASAEIASTDTGKIVTSAAAGLTAILPKAGAALTVEVGTIAAAATGTIKAGTTVVIPNTKALTLSGAAEGILTNNGTIVVEDGGTLAVTGGVGGGGGGVSTITGSGTITVDAAAASGGHGGGTLTVTGGAGQAGSGGSTVGFAASVTAANIAVNGTLTILGGDGGAGNSGNGAGGIGGAATVTASTAFTGSGAITVTGGYGNDSDTNSGGNGGNGVLVLPVSVTASAGADGSTGSGNEGSGGSTYASGKITVTGSTVDIAVTGGSGGDAESNGTAAAPGVPPAVQATSSPTTFTGTGGTGAASDTAGVGGLPTIEGI